MPQTHSVEISVTPDVMADEREFGSLIYACQEVHAVEPSTGLKFEKTDVAEWTFNLTFVSHPSYVQTLDFSGGNPLQPTFNFPAGAGWRSALVDQVRVLIVACLQFLAAHPTMTELELTHAA
jgi:hypothetical protein